uniref:RNA1 polyprotein n=1 Tax=Hansenia oviformis nepovirus TaxID=3115769 RepID=A0AAT9JBH5_9SECO
MGFTCPSVGCVYSRSTWSNRQLKEDGLSFSMRCPGAMCGALLVKEVPKPSSGCATAVAPVVSPVVSQTTAAIGGAVNSAPRAYFRRSEAEVVVEVGSPALLSFVYPPVVGRPRFVGSDFDESLLARRPCAGGISCVPAGWAKPRQSSRTAPSKVLPSWVSEARRLLKAALSGSKAFGPAYCRAHLREVQIRWALSLLLKAAPPTIAFGRQMKESFLRLKSRIDAARSKKQAKRSARRQEACKKIRMARFQANGLAQLERAQARQSGAGIYRATVCAKRVEDPTKVRFKRKRAIKAPIPPPAPVQEFPEGLVTPTFWESSGLLASAEPRCSSGFKVDTDVHTMPLFERHEFQVGPKFGFRSLGVSKPRLPQSPLEALNILWESNLFEDGELEVMGDLIGKGLQHPQAFMDAAVLVSYYGQEQMVDDFHHVFADDLPQEVRAAFAADVAGINYNDVLACGISDFVSGMRASLSKWITNPVTEKASKWCSTVIDTVRGLFDKFLGPYKKIVDGLSYIESLWGKCKKWAQNVLQEGSRVFSIMWETHCVSFVIIIACACTILIENVLKTLGIVPFVGTLTGFVLSAALGILGCGCILAKSEDFALVSGAIKCFLGALLCPPNMEELDLNAPLIREEIPAMSWAGVDRVLGALSAVGTGLCGFKADSIIYWGRFAQSFDSMRRGKDALCSMAAWMFDQLGQVYNRVTGKETAFFHELSSLVSIDVQGWLRDSARVMRESVVFAKTDGVAFHTVERLLCDGEVIQNTASADQRHHSMQFGQILNERMRELKRLRNDMAHAGTFEGRRVVPFWLYIYGPAGCGKTTSMHAFSQSLLQAFEYPSDSLCSKNPNEEFWSMYRRQALVQVDDMGASSESKLQQEMIPIVSSCVYNPAMAVAEEKTTLFDSRFIVTTSNFFTAGTDAKIADLDAFNRRRKVVLKTRGKPGVEFNSADPTAAAQFMVVCGRPDDGKRVVPIWTKSGPVPDTEEGYWMDYKDAQAYCVEQARIHHNNEDIEQQQYLMSVNKARHLYQVCENYISEVKDDVMEFIPGDKLAAMNLTQKGRFLFSCVDGRVYSYGADKCAHDEGPCDPTLSLEQVCIDKLAVTIQKDMGNGPKSPTAGIFLRSMVSGECAVESVDSLNKSASKEHVMFFKTLPLADRVYLRLVQKKILQISLSGDPLGVRSYNCLLEGFTKSYAYVKENGGRLLLILTSCILLAIACYTFFNGLATIIGGTSVAAGAAAMMNIEACASTSIYSSEYGSKMHRRNMPHRSREIPAMSSTGDHNFAEWQLCGLLETSHSDMPAVHVNLIPGNRIALTKHQAKSIPEGSSVGLSFPGSNFRTFQWRYSAVVEHENSEICFYFDSRIPSLSKQSIAMYSDADLDALSVKYMATRTLHFGIDSRTQEVTKRHWDADASVIFTPKTIVSTINGVIYRQEIPSSITYKRNSVKHDCGALVFTTIKGKSKVIGMLVGSLAGVTYVCKFPDVQPDVYACVGEVRGYNLEPGVSHAGYQKIGWVSKRHEPHNSSKTEFVPIPEKYHMENVPCKIPAVLSAKDDRLVDRPNCAGYDPYKDGMEKFKTPMAEIDEDLLQTVCDEITQEFVDAGVRGRMVSMREAINGHTKLHPITPFYVKSATTVELNDMRAGCDTEVWTPEGEDVAEFEYPLVVRDESQGKSKCFCDFFCDGKEFEGCGTDAISLYMKSRSPCCQELFFDPLDLSTSEGYPLIMDRPGGAKGKERFFEGGEGQKWLIPDCPLDVMIRDGIEETKRGTPTIIIKESAKDELLKESKVLPEVGKPGTRLFSICPSWYNIVVRQQFVYLAESVRRQRRSLSSQVGIVVGSREWDDLAARLRSKKNDKMYCCDYSKFDGLMTPQVMHAICGIYNRMYTGKDGMGQFRTNLLMGLCNRISICGSQVFRVEAGIPSGFALTVDINSIFNEILVRCAYRSLVPEVERPFFSRRVVLVTYGDDNVLGIHPDVETWFNGNAIKQYMLEEMSIRITDGADKLSPTIEARPLEQCEFLKRTWVLDKQYGLYRAPLVEASIFSCLRYVRQQNYDWQMPLLQNVQGSLYEASLHGREMHEKIFRHFKHHFPKWVEDHELDSYEQCRTRFIAAKNGDFNFHPASAQLGHVYSQQPEVQELSSGQNPKRIYKLCDRIIICAGSHSEPDCFYVDVRSKARVFTKNGHHVPPVFGSGSGQLGSVKWATKFRSSSALSCRDDIVERYKSGENVYFRDNGELLNAWLAAINFAWSVNADGLDGLLQVYRKVGPTHVDDLSYYFEGGIKGYKAPPNVKVYGADIPTLSRLCPETVFEAKLVPKRSANLNARAEVQRFLGCSGESLVYECRDSSKVCFGLKCRKDCVGHISSVDVVRASPHNLKAAKADVFRRGCFSLIE